MFGCSNYILDTADKYSTNKSTHPYKHALKENYHKLNHNTANTDFINSSYFLDHNQNHSYHANKIYPNFDAQQTFKKYNKRSFNRRKSSASSYKKAKK
jgi:NAD-dependent oxidoreductase involved in siderophore biosynthesis